MRKEMLKISIFLSAGLVLVGCSTTPTNPNAMPSQISLHSDNKPSAIPSNSPKNKKTNSNANNKTTDSKSNTTQTNSNVNTNNSNSDSASSNSSSTSASSNYSSGSNKRSGGSSSSNSGGTPSKPKPKPTPKPKPQPDEDDNYKPEPETPEIWHTCPGGKQLKGTGKDGNLVCPLAWTAAQVQADLDRSMQNYRPSKKTGYCSKVGTVTGIGGGSYTPVQGWWDSPAHRDVLIHGTYSKVRVQKVHPFENDPWVWQYVADVYGCAQ